MTGNKHRFRQQRLLLTLQQAEAKIRAMQYAKTEPIAIIGMGCRLPGGASDPNAYWQLLAQGIDAITEVPANRWPVDRYYHPDPEIPGRTYTRSGGFLQHPIEEFDPLFFGISPKEAIKLDPQQRLLLEVSWEAIEQAGLTLDQLRGSQTGVFIGVSTHDYEYQIYSDDLDQIDAYGGLGNSLSITAGRIAYFLGLQGPTFQLDTACSSSLVTTHLACQSLRLQECHLAIVGGVNLTLSPLPTIFFCKTQALSPDGRCKAFDASADGYGRGEGCGILVLKRLSNAVADGDNILALIRGSAINHDGASSGLTVPNKRAQQQLLRQALANAHVTPQEVSYIEAHGTGTSLGDPIEIEALGVVFGQDRSSENPLIVGSVKTNIGHLEAAAGVAGLIKVILSLQHQQIPAHLHFKNPSPRINWNAWPIHIPTENYPWLESDRPRIAGISSFGFSGTNAHLVLEEFGVSPSEMLRERSSGFGVSPKETLRERGSEFEVEISEVSYFYLVVLSAKTEAALVAQVKQYAAYLKNNFNGNNNCNLDIEAISYTTTVGRSHFKHRLALIVTSAIELQEQLQTLAKSSQSLLKAVEAIPNIFLGQVTSKSRLILSNFNSFPLEENSPQESPQISDQNFRTEKFQIPNSVRVVSPKEKFRILKVLAQAYIQGESIDWSTLWQNSSQQKPQQKIQLPTYPFQRQRYWLDPQKPQPPNSFGEASPKEKLRSRSVSARETPFAQRLCKRNSVRAASPLEKLRTPNSEFRIPNSINSESHPLLGHRLHLAGSIDIRFESQISADYPAYVQYHRVYGKVIVPAASFFEMVLSAGVVVYKTAALMLEDVLVQQPLVLSSQELKTVQLVLTPESQTSATLCIFSLSIIEDKFDPDETLHVVGKLSVDTQQQLPSSVNLITLQARMLQQHNASVFYEQLTALGIDIDPPLRSLQTIQQGNTEALFSYQLPQQWMEETIPYTFHPVLLDGCVQVGGFSCALFQAVSRQVHLPFGVDRLRFYNSPGDRCWCYSQKPQTEAKGTTLRIDLQLLDDNGHVLMDLEGLLVRPAPPQALDDRHLQSWLYEVQWRPQPRFNQPLPHTFLPNPDQIFTTTFSSSALPPPFLPNLLQDLSDLAVSYILQGLQTLGWTMQPGELITTDTLIQRLGIVPQQQRLFQRLLQILAEEQFLQVTENGWQVLRSSEWTIPLVELHDRYPEAKSELDLLATCGSNLVALLRGAVDPLQVIFPDGDLSLATGFYETSPGAKLVNSWIQNALEQVLVMLPPDRGIRVLEIGAGTGGTTSAVLPLFNPQQTDYLFTDLSSLFLINAQNKFQNFPFVRYQTLDIEHDPTGQGFELHQFDLVIAANVLHATTSLHQTLNHVRQLLAPGGLLLLLEGTDRQRWMDLIFGLLEGWWKFQDFDLRPDYPLVNVTTWRHLLQAHGFTAVRVFPDDFTSKVSANLELRDSRIFESSPQNLILAQASVAHPQMQNDRLKQGWLVFADRNGVAQQLADQIRSQGQSCILVIADSQNSNGDDLVARSDLSHPIFLNPGDLQAFKTLITAVTAQMSLQGIVQCWPLSSHDLTSATELGCRTTLHLVQALLNANLPALPRLWLVTQGAQSVSGKLSSPAQSILWGLAKGIALECPELHCTRIDLEPWDDFSNLTAIATTLWAEISSLSDEDQVAFRDRQRYVARLSRCSLTTKTPLKISESGTYLITGGLGGLGLLVARWLVDKGAKQILLMGRAKPTAEAQSQIATLEAMGAIVTVAQVDVADDQALIQAMSTFQQQLPPLRGVFHSAGVLDDGLLPQQTWDRFEKVMAPKIQGAWNLHQLTLDRSLDFFVLFSSAAALLGSPGQSNHSAANAFLDALAHYRRQFGLPGLSINWSAISQVGSAAAKQADIRFQQWGLGMISPPEFLILLEEILESSNTQVGVLPIDWSGALRQPLKQKFYQDWWLPSEIEISEIKSTILETLAEAIPHTRKALLTEYLQSEVARVLALSSTQIVDLDQGFFELGMDSLTSVELRNRLQRNLNCTIPSTTVFDYPTVGELVEYLFTKVLDSETDRSVSDPSSSIVQSLPNPYSNKVSLSSDSVEFLTGSKIETLIEPDLDKLSEEQLAILLFQELESIKHL
jgi:acyl transferase domain-containing protein/acyl carrier protein